MRNSAPVMCLLVIGLFMTSGMAFAQETPVQTFPSQTASPGSWQAPPPTTLTVAAKNAQVAPEADATRTYVSGLLAEWGRTFGWTQSVPISVLVYRSGEIMGADVGWFRVFPLNSSEMNDASSRIGFTVRDARPIGPGGGMGGWIITLNANYDRSIDLASTVQTTTLTTAPRGALSLEERGFLAHELAGIMLQDITGTGGQAWLRAGVADLIMNSEVQGLSVTATRQMALSSAAGGGTVPGPVTLTNSWDTLSASGGPTGDAAYGMADATALFLVQRVGMQPVLSILRRTSAGEDFNTVLQQVTGLSVWQLDSEMVARAR